MRLSLILLLCVVNLYAEPFSKAKVTKSTGKVTLLGKTSIKTGPESKAELDFLDGTVVRLGSNASFRFSPGSREMALDSGTLLFSAPKDAGGGTVRSGGITTTATGATDFEVANVKGSVKVINLNGKLTSYVTANPKAKDGLRPGQMLDIPPGATNLPRADSIDLKVLLTTSTLMQMGALPSKATLDRNANKQKATLPINLPGGAENTIQSAAATRQVIAQQEVIQEQLDIARQIAAKQLEAQNQQRIAAQQAQQLAIQQQQQDAKIAADAEAARIQQQQQIANTNTGNQGNQGQGPQGNQGQNPSSPPGQGNQGNKPNSPPGQQKK